MPQKSTGGICGLSPLILNPDSRQKPVVSFTPEPLYLREKSPGHPMNSNLGGPRRQFGHFGLKKNFLLLPRIKTLFFRCPPSSLGIMLSTLSRLASQINTFPLFNISISFYTLLLVKNRVPCTRSIDLQFEKKGENRYLFCNLTNFFLKIFANRNVINLFPPFQFTYISERFLAPYSKR